MLLPTSDPTQTGIRRRHHDLGAVLVPQDRLDEALVCFDCAIALAPNLAMAYLHRGDVYRSKRMHNAAILNYREYLNCDRQHWLP